jgi:hypothetical protein
MAGDSANGIVTGKAPFLLELGFYPTYPMTKATILLQSQSDYAYTTADG